MSGAPTPYLEPPPEPRTVECEMCGGSVGADEVYHLRGGNLCLDCAASVAISTIAGTPRTISEEELETAFLAVHTWLASRKGALLSGPAKALRAAYRSQAKRTM